MDSFWAAAPSKKILHQGQSNKVTTLRSNLHIQCHVSRQVWRSASCWVFVNNSTNYWIKSNYFLRVAVPLWRMIKGLSNFAISSTDPSSNWTSTNSRFWPAAKFSQGFEHSSSSYRIHLLCAHWQNGKSGNLCMSKSFSIKIGATHQSCEKVKIDNQNFDHRPKGLELTAAHAAAVITCDSRTFLLHSIWGK